VERAQLPPWFVVGLGSGIGACFALGDPMQWGAFLCIAVALALGAFVLGSGRTGRALGWFALAAAVGCALVWARSAWVERPRLERPVVAEFDASVESVDPLAAKETVRVLLKPAGGSLPPLIRVSVDEDKMPAGVASGAAAHMRARLAPPPPMALPGTYDFARDAWFRGLGAVGKTLGPVTVTRPAEPKGLDRVRDSLRRHIASRLPASTAGIAVALATGDQNAVDEEDAEAMRRSGLTHLLSSAGCTSPRSWRSPCS
jgi:competence protein ComEC